MRLHLLGLFAATLFISVIPVLPIFAQAPITVRNQEVSIRELEAFPLLATCSEQFQISHFQESIEACEEALSIFRETGNRLYEAEALSGLGWAYQASGRIGEAFNLSQMSLDIVREIGDRRLEVHILNLLAYIQIQLGQYQESITLNQRGLDILISNGINARFLEAIALADIGLAYSSLGNPEQALYFAQQALPISQGFDLLEGWILNDIGNSYQMLGQYNKAIEFHQQAVAISRKANNGMLEVVSLNSLGEIYQKLEQYQQAMEMYQQALSVAQKTGYLSGKGRAFRNIGSLSAQRNQTELAIAFYKQSVNITELIRGEIQTLSQDLQQSYVDSVSDTYRELADLLLSQGRVLEAEQVLELLKIQEIREYTRGAVVNPETGEIRLSPAETEILAAHESLIAFASTYAECTRTVQCSDEVIEQYQQLNREWYAAVESFAERVAQRRSEDDEALVVSNLQSVGKDIVGAQPGTVLIYPLVLEDKLWILWITEGGVANSIEVPVTERELADAVLEFRQLMRGCEVRRCNSDADIQAIQTVSQQLYRWLIPPQLEAEFEQNEIQNLVFALDRAIRYIPMAALFDGENYLVENYTISNITAAGLTNRDNPLPPGAETSVLALGLSESVPANPANGIPGFSSLPYVPQELSAIVQSDEVEGGIYQGLNLLNDDFHQNSLRQAPSHQILHIATHGLFDPVVLNSSFLVLGTKEPLRITDLERELGATVFSHLSLVVLSACETALGEPEQYVNGSIPDGREISGIAQAFIDLGANAVVASLWQINDPATSALMQQFYGALAQGTAESPVTISQSLRQAQLSLINGDAAAIDDGIRGGTGTVVSVPTSNNRNAISSNVNYSHPYYWAPFILIGNGL